MNTREKKDTSLSALRIQSRFSPIYARDAYKLPKALQASLSATFRQPAQQDRLPLAHTARALPSAAKSRNPHFICALLNSTGIAERTIGALSDKRGKICATNGIAQVRTYVRLPIGLMPKREPIRSAPGSWHHLTLFTANRQTLFQRPILTTTLQSTLNAIRERHGLRVVAYCIMPNHLTWAVQVTEYSLEVFALHNLRRGSRSAENPADHFIDRMMVDLRALSASALRRTDPNLPHEVWQKDFWHDAIADSAALATSMAAIHGLPIRWNLCQSPAEYAYSSYAHVVYGRSSLVQLDRVPRSMMFNQG